MSFFGSNEGENVISLRSPRNLEPDLLGIIDQDSIWRTMSPTNFGDKKKYSKSFEISKANQPYLAVEKSNQIQILQTFFSFVQINKQNEILAKIVIRITKHTAQISNRFAQTKALYYPAIPLEQHTFQFN